MLHEIGDFAKAIQNSILLQKKELNQSKTLKRSVGLVGVVIISLSAMLPGIFVTPTSLRYYGCRHLAGIYCCNGFTGAILGLNYLLNAFKW